MLRSALLALISLSVAARAQGFGTYKGEIHPDLTTQVCTSTGCTDSATSIVLDANWRWTHETTGYSNCYTGNTWNATICSDPTLCAQNCDIEGADYTGTYGISTTADLMRLNFVTKTSTGNNNVGSRVYLMADETNYQMFKLLNREFTFDVDVSELPCGLNGALYFTEMSVDGGYAAQPDNRAGAKYGTGYCDAQCPQDIKFISGKANVLDWVPSKTDANSGTGSMGSCCSEMDIWEANSQAQAFTPHPCSVSGQTECTGTDCGAGSDRYNGVCDKDGCDFNPYRLGNETFYGNGKTVDTGSKFTVVTQFITDDGTDTGTLSAITRFFVQNGQVLANSYSNIAGVTAVNDITDDFCTQAKTAFGDTNSFSTKGGLAAMSKSLANGMVLTMSIWDDHAANALWLDSTYPVGKTGAGANRGPCATDSGVPADVEKNSPGAGVSFSNIKFGVLGSTFKESASGAGAAAVGSKAKAKASPSSSASASTETGASTNKNSKTTSSGSGSGSVAKWGQCGGTGYTGATACVAGTTCKASNSYYSQCL